MSEHTPGPWTMATGPSSHLIEGPHEYDGCNIFVAQVAIPEDETGKPLVSFGETFANGCLIAAAPDMLKALEEGVRVFGPPEDWQHPEGVTTVEERAMRKMIAAVAKARGEE